MLQVKKSEGNYVDVEEVKAEKVFESSAKAVFQGLGENLVNYRIYGNSVERKNLLKNTATSQTINGVTFTVNEDGSVTAYGTATARVNFYLNRNLTIPEGDYIVSLTTVGAYSNSSIPLIILQNFGDYTYAVVNTTIQLTVTSNPGNAIIQIPSASEVDCTFYPMIRKANIEDSTYEPYIENTSVGDLQANGKYLVPVTVSGKNLAPTILPQSSGGINIQQIGDGIYSMSGTSQKQNNFVFTLNLSLPMGDYKIVNMGTVRIALDFKDISGATVFKSPNPGEARSFSYPDNVQRGINIYVPILSNDTVDGMVKYMIIRASGEYNTYEPYHEPQTVNIELDEPLRKVGNETDYIDFREQKQHRVRKNILQNTATTRTINGVTFTVNDDGSIDCTRTNTQATGVSVFTINSEELSFTEDCILTGCPAGGSNGSYFMRYLYDIGTGTVQQAFDYGSGVAIPKNKSGDIQIRFASGYNFDGTLTFRPMIRKANITDDAYEPYIENTEIDVTLPALPILEGTNTLSIGTTVQPSKIWGKVEEVKNVEYIKDNFGNTLYSKYAEIESETPPISFRSVSTGNLKNYKIYGNTETIVGLNKLPLKGNAETVEINGITFINDGNGTITLSGTSTQETTYTVPLLKDYTVPICVEYGGTGCFQINNTVDFANSKESVVLKLFYDNTQIDYWYLTPTQRVASRYATMAEKTINNIKIVVAANQTVPKTSISPALYEHGISSQIPFESYNEVLTSVGDKTENLFDGELFNSNIDLTNGEITTQNNQQIVTSIFTLDSNTYTLSASDLDQCAIAFYDTQGVFSQVSEWTTLPYTFTTENLTNVRLLFKKESDEAVPANEDYNIMLNTGSSSLSYVPYGYNVPINITSVSENNLFNLSEFLNLTMSVFNGSIKRYSDSFELTSNGQDCYTVSYESGKYPYYMSAKPNTTYTLSWSSDDTVGKSRILAFLNGVPSDTTIKEAVRGEKTLTFTTSADTTSVTVRFGIRTGYASSVLFYNISFVEGEEAGTKTTLTNLYLPEPLKKVGDEAEYVDYKEQKQQRVRKNLLKNTATSKTINGVTFTVNDDGSVTCNGTAVGIYNTFFIPFKASGGTYILNGCPKSGSDNSYRLDIRDSSSRVIAFDYGEGTGGVQLGDSAAYRITIRFQQNYICDNLTFYPMIRPADIDDDTYESYVEDTELDIELPNISLIKGINNLNIDTTVQPSKIYLKGKIKNL